MNSKQIRILLINLLIILFQIPLAQAQTRIKNIRHWTAPDHTRIVFDLDTLPQYRISPESAPKHPIIELANTHNTLRYAKFKIGDGLVDTVRIKTKDKNTLGIIIDLAIPTKIDPFTLKKFYGKPNRLVIDVLKPVKKALRRQELEAATKAKQKGQRIVLIDPGHGGEDPGAIGKRLRLQEKKVVLKIAQYLYYLLKRTPGITPYLSRRGDYYLSLHKRTQLAEEYKADLMLSIHANASKSSKLQGGSAYYLSPKGASSEAAKLLAQKENAADLIGGVSLNQDKTLSAILIDMLQTSSVNDSIKLGKSIIAQMEGISQVTMDKELHSAPFAVLKSPTTPSILLETAFISNPQEERLLANPKFQQQVARRLALAIKNYLEKTAPAYENVASPQKKATSGKQQIHVVKRGETVWRIAKKYGIAPAKLRKANSIGHSNFIRVGQKLHIPR